MPRISFPGFCGPSNLQGLPSNGSSMPLSAERAVNLYAEKLRLPWAGSDYALIGRPGLSQTGFPCTVNSPVRALWSGAGRLFAVGGMHFYEISSSGAVLTDYGAMPSSTGAGPCTIIQNAGSSAFALVVWDSSSNQLYAVSRSSMVSLFNATFQEYLDGFQTLLDATSQLAVFAFRRRASRSRSAAGVWGFGQPWAALSTWIYLSFALREALSKSGAMRRSPGLPGRNRNRLIQPKHCISRCHWIKELLCLQRRLQISIACVRRTNESACG
jgi:hypothetical protein